MSTVASFQRFKSLAACRSDEPELGLRVVEDDRAGRAVPPRLHRRATHLVVGGLDLGVPGPPGTQQPQGAGEVLPLLAEAVGEARRPLRVGFGDDEEILLLVLLALGHEDW